MLLVRYRRHHYLIAILFLLVLSAVTFIYKVYLSKPAPRRCPETNDHESDLAPNVVHFVHLVQGNATDLSFVSLICALAAFFNQKPDRLVFHTNHVAPELSLVKEKRFARLKSVVGNKLTLNRVRRPTHAFGRPLGNIYHANDVLKIQLALKHGGLYIDQDTFIVRSIDELRRYETTLGWPKDQFIGIQFILCKPGAAFLRLWQESYRDYRPSLWYYNAGQYPTEHILSRCPELVHREEVLLGVQDLTDRLYMQDWDGWKEYYAVHLLNRHRNYRVNRKFEEFDEENIKKYYNTTFGRMARLVLEKLEEQ